MRKGSVVVVAAVLGVALGGGAFVRSEPAPAPSASASPAAPSPAPSPALSPAAKAPAAPNAFDAEVTPLLQRYCYECHGDGASAGELELDHFAKLNDLTAARETWDKVIQYVRTQTMPPPDAEHRLGPKERDLLANAIERHVYQIDPDKPDPGRVAIRRLNRVEYRNIMRDLTGVTFDPTLDFPQDDTGYGFDNIADVLTLPPMLMEKYLAAAEKVLDEALPPQQGEPRERRIPATEARANFSLDGRVTPDGKGVTLSSREEDALSVMSDAPAAGDYRVRVQAYAKQTAAAAPSAGTPRPSIRLSLMLGDAVVYELNVTATDPAKPGWYEGRVGVPAGRHAIRAAVRRVRGVREDKQPTAGRVGAEQPGSIVINEIRIEGPLPGAVRRITAPRIETAGETARRESNLVALHRDGDEAHTVVEVGKEGQYILRAQAYADHAGDAPARAELRVDDRPIRTFDIAAPSARKASPATDGLSDAARRAVPRVYEVQMTLSRGKHRVGLRFLNNLRDDEHPDPNFRDRNVYAQHFEFVELGAAPGSAPMSAPMRALFARHPGPENARALLAEFTLRAWRRPPRVEELDRLMKLYALARRHGEDHPASVRHAMKGVLVSSSFLFHGEVSPPREPVAEVYRIDEYELASRLSFFLWSSGPDDVLLDLARRGELRKSLDAQVKRMLRSDKSRALVENFAGQWLQFRNLDAVHPDRRTFDDYDDRLRDAMQTETRLFFQSIVREDRSLMDVLTGDYTFVNERLARHYGIKSVDGNAFRRVSLAGTPRRGVLTQGSVLTLTSNPTRTSPVKRGKWVLENLLGVAPPPPPPELPTLESTESQQKDLTVRQRFELHRADPACASCHAPMDPIGFSLENFDAIGRFREKDGVEKIDATAQFPDGATFTGAGELVKILAGTRQDDFYRAAAQASLTFALGRGVEPSDRPAVDKIVDELKRNDGKFSSLVNGIVNSVPFQMRRADADTQQARIEDGE